MSTVLLKPIQAMASYDTIADAIAKGLGQIEVNQEQRTNLMEAVSSGTLHPWLLLRDKGPGVGLVTTCFLFDPWIGKRSLVIYSLYVKEGNPLSVVQWKSVMDALENFAAENDCASISAVTDDERIAAGMKRFGWKEGRRSLVKEIGNERS